ncbi:MAG: PKD domain-containing protein [Candidatus Thermoplasmatota archaeon]
MKKIIYIISFLLLLCQVIAINSPPIAQFTYEINGKFVIFYASSSYDPDGYIVNYTWDFGDGSIGYGIIVNHTYENEGIYNVTLFVEDNSGNRNSTTKIVIIDITPPSTICKLNPEANGRNGWYVSNAILILNAIDYLSGVNKSYYKIGAGAWSEYVAPVAISEEGDFTIYYYSFDNSGNYEETKVATVKIDKSPPSTLIFIDKNSSNGWYKEKINVSLFSNDLVSGIDRTFYRINGGEFLEYNGSVSLLDGKYIFEFFSIDVAGNFEENNRVEIKVDTIAPEINIVSPIKGVYIFGRKIIDAEITLIIGNLKVEVECYDLNGVKLIEFYYDDAYRGNSTNQYASWEIDEFSIGRHEIKLVAYDFAGNKKMESEEIYIINLKWS